MRILIPALAAILLATGASGCGSDEQPPVRSACGDVAFTPQSDDGVFDIVATGVSCAQARAVATGTRDRRSGDPLSYEAGGFSCTGARVTGGGLPGVDWRCTRNGDTITFTRN